MQSGDPVTVRNLDGEEAEGEVVAILADRCDEFEVDFFGPEGATLYDYWRGEDVDPDAPVVQVDLGTGVYEYPADRVEVVD